MSTATSTRSSPGYELPRRKPYSTVLGTIIVAAVIVVYVGGLVAINENLDAGDLVPPGTVVEVGRGVTYVPANGFSYDIGRRNDALGDPDFALPVISVVTRDAEEFSVTVRQWIDTQDALTDRVRDVVGTEEGIQILSSNGTYQNANGIEFTTFSYTGVDIEGRVWLTLVEGETAIVADANAPTGEFFQSFDDFEEMVDSIEHDPEATSE